MRRLNEVRLITEHHTVNAISSLIAAVLLSVACLTGPENSVPPGAPWEPVDSAWKVIDNLEYAYNTMDIGLYMSCFREDFEFHPLELQYPPHGNFAKEDTFWGYGLEEQLHLNMFANVYLIELTIDGTQESPWPGDTTGQSYQLCRNFDLKVYYDEAQSMGCRASGSALFICRKDTQDDEWYVWHWWDLSDTKEYCTWADIKALFF